MELIRLAVGANQTNTYIVVNNYEAIIIDPGAQAWQIIEQVHECCAVVKHILITHAHFDHVGAVAELKKDGVKVYMSERDAELYDEICTVGTDIYVKPFEIDETFKDGTLLKLSGVDFKVISTPGHTPGSVCFICDDHCIFSGDTLFRLSVGRTDFVHGNRNELNNSLKKLFALKRDYTVFPGHGDPTTLYFERENNPYAY